MIFPKDRPETIEHFYGRVQLTRSGLPDERWMRRMLVEVEPPYPMELVYQPGVRLHKIVCHREVKRTLVHALAEVLAHYGSVDGVRAAGLAQIGEVFGLVRRGGGLSLHAYGAAISFSPGRWAMPVPGRKKRGDLLDGVGEVFPPAVVEIFKECGWSWGGDWEQTDPGTFQATKD